jgi:hypothetical protein
MPTLRDHLAAQDAGRGGGHHGGGHHGGHHHGGRGRDRGGVVFYDRSPDVVVVEADCPPGFYYDDFGNCRPLPYHSMRSRDSGHFDSRMRPLPCPESSGLAEMMPQGPAYDMRRATHDAGRVLPRFVTSSDVHDLKMRLNPYVISLDGIVAGCPDMPAPVRDGWEAFSQSWKTFFQQGEGFWTAGAEMDQAEAYQADLQTWQAKIATTTCKIDPVTKKPTTVPKDILPPPPSTEGATDPGVSDIAATAKTVAWVAVILAALYYADKAGVFSASSVALSRRAAR